MQSAHELVEDLSQAYKGLDSTLADEATNFSAFEQKFDGKTCPEQAELAPLLNGVQAIAIALAKFLEALIDFLANEHAIAIVRETPLGRREIGRIGARQILPFYWTVNNLNNNLHEQETAVSYIWQQTWELCAGFAYHGSSMTASSSLISWMEGLTRIFGEPSHSEAWNEETLEFICGYLERKRRLIQGLYYIADRAALLVTATESELKSEAVGISWWCQLVDSTPKDKGAYYKLQGLIGECPNPAHPDVAARLEQIAAEEGVDERIREEARLKLKGAA